MRELSSRRDASGAGCPLGLASWLLRLMLSGYTTLLKIPRKRLLLRFNVSQQAAQRLVARAVCAATHLEAALVAKTPALLAFINGSHLTSHGGAGGG